MLHHAHSGEGVAAERVLLRQGATNASCALTRPRSRGVVCGESVLQVFQEDEGTEGADLPERRLAGQELAPEHLLEPTASVVAEHDWLEAVHGGAQGEGRGATSVVGGEA